MVIYQRDEYRHCPFKALFFLNGQLRGRNKYLSLCSVKRM